MPAHYARNAYLQAQVQPETDPKRLVLMLYEEALKHIRLTREGIEERNARKRGEHLSRAVAIIAALFTALDGDPADESIAFLAGLYQAMLVELGKVALTHDVTVLDLAFRYLERLKQIWAQDVMGLTAQAAEQPRRTTPSAGPAGAPPHVTYRQAYGIPAMAAQ